MLRLFSLHQLLQAIAYLINVLKRDGFKGHGRILVGTRFWEVPLSAVPIRLKQMRALAMGCRKFTLQPRDGSSESGLRQQSECLGMEFHHLGEMREKVCDAVVARIRVIFVMDVLF